MGSEALLDEYMDQGSIAEEHLAHAVAKRELFPCYYGSALKVEGVKELLAGFANTTGHRSMKTNFLPVYTRSAEIQRSAADLSESDRRHAACQRPDFL